MSKASFRLNILRLSRIFAARRWAMDATRRLVFFDDELDEWPERPPSREEARWDTRAFICDRGHIAIQEKSYYLLNFRVSLFYNQLHNSPQGNPPISSG